MRNTYNNRNAYNNIYSKITHSATYIALVFMAVMLTSCAKNDDPNPDFDATNKASLSIQFDNIVGGKNLEINTGSYINAAGEQFNVSMLQYFISNIKLTTTTGEDYIVPQDSSYFLIKESDPESQFAKINVPVADYQTLTFTIGVDSLRSTMDVSKRTGVLDPAGDHNTSGMYWSWNSGYIFLKMEGVSPQVPVDIDAGHKFRYHIGGFGGYSAPGINNIKTVTLDLNAAGIAKVRKERQSNIHLFADLLKVFNGSTVVSLAANPSVMSGSFSTVVANNYKDMFSHDHTEN